MTESDFQRSIIAECAYRANQDPRWAFIFHVPNGGQRTKAAAGKLKAEGVKKGVPDLLWPLKSRGYSGLVMELKANGNSTTPEQTTWLAWLKAQGYFTCVVRDDPAKAIEILTWYCSTEDDDN